ncbi:P-loop containing nucleoside triphosphate hydrolase protein [Xylaria scruposa]|nr:P-loop containing nucleoside triphosphate hydrolase protein [Xylaria scruposa]
MALANLSQIKCLVSFIDDDIKSKQEYLASSRCQSVSFADVPMLFSPGGAVVSKDHKQAYRVIKISCTRHRVKARKKKTRLDFLKDEGEVELKNNPVFVHCIHLDFNGKVMGPISSLFKIQKFDGQREVTSLPIFPLQHAKEDGLREKFVERGKMFFKVIGVKHMHYTGLTLKTRDDIDSQVVIDFEEAINRYPKWKPPIRSVLDDFPQSEVPPLGKGFSDPNLRKFMKAQRSMRKVCIEECCGSELKHFDEYVEDRGKEDYIVSQRNRTVPARFPVTIVPHDFRDIMENNTLTDDEYLIMSYRVFGFVLRSRKWHELDMAHVFEVATLGADEGFDELVLPPGHGDMVKSMIRQHLRDKRFSLLNRDKTDVVRGKGRGLIILLHGVPGVGKTSTAECVADLFRRPLFQITSGDLGTTAKEVEDALEENFSLASRWNSILLIDEADVFLAERTKEDFVRNSLVAVFLRMMEYYAGVLFLTTNRVGVFDEAFTSRIHISLYYPPLDQMSTLQIFQKNWDRINTRYKEAGRVIDIDTLEITAFAIEYFENNEEGRWNGRQIRNAFQSALALAELDALGEDDFLGESDHNRPVVLGRKSFDTVADAYKGFTSYLKQVYGANFARRARENLWRFDAFGAPRMPNSLSTRLKINEPTMPPPPPPPPSGQWQGQVHGYDPTYQQPYYPPQQHYAESYDHRGQRHPYPPISRPFPYPDPKERQGPGAGAGNLDQ